MAEPEHRDDRAGTQVEDRCAAAPSPPDRHVPPGRADPRAADRRPRRALLRGLRRRCPHCGQGPLFERWTSVRERCPVCGIRYLLDQGDPWEGAEEPWRAFLLLFDRAVFILPPIAVLYFGLLPRSLPLLILGGAGLLGALLYTTPHRYGFCVACDYLTRRTWGDLAE